MLRAAITLGLPIKTLMAIVGLSGLLGNAALADTEVCEPPGETRPGAYRHEATSCRCPSGTVKTRISEDKGGKLCAFPSGGCTIYFDCVGTPQQQARVCARSSVEKRSEGGNTYEVIVVSSRCAHGVRFDYENKQRDGGPASRLKTECIRPGMNIESKRARSSSISMQTLTAHQKYQPCN